MNRPRFAYVGCLTTVKRKGKGLGIAVFHIDPDSGAWTQVSLCETLPNPSFLALDQTRGFL